MECATVKKFALDTIRNCFLCLKCCVKGDSNEDTSASEETPVASFSMKFLAKYLNLDVKEVFKISAMIFDMSLIENSEIVVPVCEDCSVFGKQFGDLYEQLASIKLQLKMCIQNIHVVMTGAQQSINKVRNRSMKKGNALSHAADMIKITILENFREETIIKCFSRLRGLDTLDQPVNKLRTSVPGEKDVVDFICDESIEDDTDTDDSQEKSSHSVIKGHSTTKEKAKTKNQLLSESADAPIPSKTAATSTTDNLTKDNFLFDAIPMKNTETNAISSNSTIPKNVEGKRKSSSSYSPSYIHKCNLCYVEYPREGHLAFHQRYTHKELFFKPYKNPRVSNEKFKDLVEEVFEDFSYKKDKDGKLKCIYCDQSGFGHPYISNHMIKTHLKQLVPLVLTKQSDIFINLHENDEAVLLDNIPVPAPVQKTTIFKCNSCPATFITLGKRVSHERLLHKEFFFQKYKDSRVHCENFKNLVEEVFTEFQFKMTRKNGYKCSFCNLEGYSSKQLVTSHMMKIHLERYVPMIRAKQMECIKEIISEEIVEKTTPLLPPPEKKIISIQVSKCHMCGKRLNTKLELEKHLEDHNKLKCIHCNKNFTTRGSLRGHILTQHWTLNLLVHKGSTETKTMFEARLTKLIRKYVIPPVANVSAKCEICDKILNTETHVEVHILQDHLEDVKEDLELEAKLKKREAEVTSSSTTEIETNIKDEEENIKVEIGETIIKMEIDDDIEDNMILGV